MQREVKGGWEGGLENYLKTLSKLTQLGFSVLSNISSCSLLIHQLVGGFFFKMEIKPKHILVSNDKKEGNS